MANYDLKSYVIENGLHKVQRDISKAFYNESYGKSLYTPYDYETALALDISLKENMKEEYQEAYRVNHSSYARKTRLQNRIRQMLNAGNCVFVTLTFTDYVLESTSSDTRRQYVRRTLHSFGVPFVANIDFGEEKGREHYHAVVQIDRLPSNFWKYGICDIEKVRLNSKSDIKLAKYITKLTNHAIKETCRGCKCIYSRN